MIFDFAIKFARQIVVERDRIETLRDVDLTVDASRKRQSSTGPLAEYVLHFVEP